MQQHNILKGVLMKLTVAVLALSLSFTSLAFASESLVISSNVQEVLTLRKISKTSFNKISSVVTGSVKVEAKALGQTYSASDAVNNTDQKNDITLEVTGKNIVRVINTTEKINSEVAADINKSLLGKIKSITIDSKAYEALYAESMKKSGLDLLKKLQISDLSGASIETSITTSDLVCNADGDLLICNQDAEISIALTTK